MPSRAAPSSTRSLGVLIAGFSLRWFGFSFYNFFILLFLHTSFALTFAVAGLSVAVIAAVALPFAQIGGGLSDRFGRRRVVVLSLAGEASGLAMLAGGFASASLPLVLGALVVSGSFAAIGFPATVAYVRDSTEDRTRTAGLSWLRAGGNFGALGGVALGGVLLAFVTYSQLAEIAAALLGAGAAVNAIWLSPSPRDLSNPDKLSSHPPSTIDPEPGILNLLGQTSVASFKPIWRDRTLSLIVLAITPMCVLNLQIAYAVPTFGHTVLQIPYGILGTLLALNGLIPAVAQVPLTVALAGRRLTRVGIWGTALYVVSFLALGLEGEVRIWVAIVFAATVAASSLAENLCFLPMFALPLNVAPEGSRGVYSGAIVTAEGIGAVFAPLVAGVALNLSTSSLAIWGILAAPAVPAIAILWRLESRIPLERNLV